MGFFRAVAIALDDGLEGLLHLSEMGDGTLKEPHSYVKKSDRLQLRISRLEPEKRRVGFTQRWGTEQPILSSDEEAVSVDDDDDDIPSDEPEFEAETSEMDADVVNEVADDEPAEDEEAETEEAAANE